MVFTAWKSIVQFLPALVFAMLAGNSFLIGVQFFGGLAVLFALAHAFAYQALYRYRLGPEELVVREGVLSRTVRHVPYHRIQNINLVQNLLHRALGVYRVQLESASGDKPEAVMPALSAAAVEELQARIDAVRSPMDGAEDVGDDTPILELGIGEVVRLGLVSWRGLVVAGAITGFFFQFGEQLPIWSSIGDRIGAVTEAELAAGWVHATVRLVVGGAAVLTLLTIFSIALAVFRYHGFTLRRRGRVLRTSFGLLTRVTNTIPTERIQLITCRQGMIQRLLRRRSVNVETAGQMDHSDGDSAGLSALAPIVPESDTRRILEVAQPDVDWDEPVWIRLHPRAGVRLARRRLRILAAVAVAAAVGFSPWALLVLLPAPLIWWSSHRWARASAVAITPTAVFHRSGWLARSMSVVRYRKGQTVSISTSPFDRRWKMATLAVDTAGARPMGHRIAVPYLAVDEAEQLQVFLAERLSRSDFRW
jgi:putative membrane protein